MNLIFDLIDMRSFSNLWYWIALAVTWSSASHWVLGVPYDMVLRARRKGGNAAQQFEQITRINVARLLYLGREAGITLTALISFLLTMLAVLGFVYRIEIAQAIFLMVFPLSGVGILSLRTAQKIERLYGDCEGQTEALAQVLARHRMAVQIIGLFAISSSAFWGMFQNLQASILH
ncbi:component of SufBCD complex [Albirhodobacter sp. R86504]|uniref:component of SufBCD complex n=1 Tax=Albirhodobacter sp. R86504 TaxID=3093848 RepID=UPI003670A053